ncbi:Ig-like domain-containing protein [Pantoea sp. FN060301]|uniref:Ig-like domain-containing protein n=1 Tax=Pantoea sp. FN060301 TaxID=3420380 RepID=UPI003D166479
MAISGLDHVTRLSGKPLEQSPSATEQTVLLSQPGIVELQGSRSQVAAYQQQGEDLILQLPEGQALRYQHFFSVVDGKQSELVFVGDDNLRDRVQFSETLQADPQAVTALMPLNLADAGEAAVSEAGSGASSAVGLALGMLGLVGGGVALAASGGGSSDEKASSVNPVVNENEGAAAGQAASQPAVAIGREGETVESTLAITAPVNGEGTLPVTAPVSGEGTPAVSAPVATAVTPAIPDSSLMPQPTLRTPFGDGWVNNAESHHAQRLCGTTGMQGANQQVALVINGVSYAATVDNNGNWRQLLPADAMMEVLHNGSNAIQITATNASGQSGTLSTHFMVDTDAPALSINTIAGDGQIDRAEMTAPVIISGLSEAAVAGQVITMALNGQTMTSAVAADGSWRFTLEPQVMQGLSDGQHNLTVSLADAAGNVSTEMAGFYLLPASGTQPTLAVNTISGDDMLNMREAIYGLEISGSSTHLAAGTEVTLTLDGKTFTGAVWDNAGNWQIFLDDVALASIADGQHTLSFSALDESGNGATVSRDVWMITHQSSEPQFTVNEVTQADVSTQDGINYVTLSGSLSADFPITAASVNPGDYPLYDFTIAEDGSWSVTIRQSDLSITDGFNSMIFSVADIAGNSYEGLQEVEVHIDPALFNSLMLAEGETALDFALLGLNAEQLATEEPLSDRGEAKANAPEAEASSEFLTTTDGKTISLSTAEGGVWNDSSFRVAAGQPDDIYAYGNAGHENTLADLLAQHNLQVQTT